MLKKTKSKIGNLGTLLIRFIAKKLKINLINLAYSENGILKSHSFKASGELYFINSFLKTKVESAPVFFDVGGNKGEYTLLLRRQFPDAIIHTFEPNPHTFDILKKKCVNSEILVNKGIGEKNDQLDLYFDKNDPLSVQASSDPRILRTITKSKDIVSEKIEVITLDEYAKLNNIRSIDLLKIDTEGFELEALQGAKELLNKQAIKIIQFEFNEVNIVKRRFLKDFYDILPGFKFYRLDENRLIPLLEWKPIHEIFKFQNIVAIHK